MVRVPLPALPIVRVPVLLQLPPEMVAVPLLLALSAMEPLALETLPPLIVSVPLPALPTVRLPVLVQLPPEMVAVPLPPALSPMEL